MKKRLKHILPLALAVFVLCIGQTGCGSMHSEATEPFAGETEQESHMQENSGDRSEPAEDTPDSAGEREAVTVRVGSLKGPTSLGILSLMEKSGANQTFDTYQFCMATGADELLPLMVKGELDIALLPANVASVLYARTNGEVVVIDINTLGVLYLVTASESVRSIADLKGRTICLTGRGTTPEAAIRFLCRANGLAEEDYELEFKSEATEVAVALANDPEVIGLLPQPFVTAAMMQNASLQIAVDLNEAWRAATASESGMVTGVTVVRRQFFQDHPEAVAAFVKEHAQSVEAVNTDVEAAAKLAAEAGIVAKEQIAQKAIPACNLVCVTGEEMKSALSAYLEVLESFEKALVGGQVPGDDFYGFADEE